MKKLKVALLIIIPLVLAAFLGFRAYEGHQEELHFKTQQAQGQDRAESMLKLIADFKSTHGRFPSWSEIEAFEAQNSFYYMSIAENDLITQKMCPDCRTSNDGFKILMYANLDDDSELDQFILKSEVPNLEHKVNDLKE